MTKLRYVPLLALPLLASLTPSTTRAQADDAHRAQALIAGLDYDDARHVLSAADVDAPAVALERARLAIYELNCDGAAAILARPEVLKIEGGEMLADIARGCARVTAALAVDRDEKRGIEVRWQDEHDRALAPLLFDTVDAARKAITRDLGVDWPLPTRIVVVRDLLSLSAMTGLPYKSAQTTGTVAVAKWGRVTLLSPRASHHGYSWRDTVTHELTHLAVTRASRDQAPLWLQEGVAKREEIRWRDPGPFDDRPSPDAVVQRGLELNLGLPLDKLGPSIAMLPSADAAMVAFAEVTSFVRFYAHEGGDDALPKLFHELREGKEPDAALQAASGADLKAWDVRWRAYIAARPREPIPALFGLGGEKGDAEKLRDLRDRTRLAELLLSRAHPGEALFELDRIALAGSPVAPEAWERAMGDPSARWLRGRALEAVGRREEGEPLVADPKQVLSSYGPWWALRGRWARIRGDEATATSSFIEAVADDPFDDEAACETIDPASAPSDPGKKALCEAARARGELPYEPD
ncbi:MAG TPA: hypothetical protein VHS09_05370 [Polyangiaceae bacterium]|nr:hypothetical protein [Polyangiaceae bacterium]